MPETEPTCVYGPCENPRGEHGLCDVHKAFMDFFLYCLGNIKLNNRWNILELLGTVAVGKMQVEALNAQRQAQANARALLGPNGKVFGK